MGGNPFFNLAGLKTIFRASVFVAIIESRGLIWQPNKRGRLALALIREALAGGQGLSNTPAPRGLIVIESGSIVTIFANIVIALGSIVTVHGTPSHCGSAPACLALVSDHHPRGGRVTPPAHPRFNRVSRVSRKA